MKRRQIIRLVAAAAGVLGMLALAAYRYHASQPVRRSGLTMGTIPLTITAVPGPAGRARAAAGVAEAIRAIGRVNRVMSTYLPTSDLSRLNAARAGQAVRLDPELTRLLRTARELSAATDGAFDPTGRGLFTLWKQAIADGRLPTDRQVAEARAAVGWSKVTVDPAASTAIKAADAVQIDLGAIAKGYAVDVAIERIRAAGAAGGLVEVGGEVRVFGESPKGGQWLLAVRNPFYGADGAGRPEYACRLRVGEAAVATSGDYFQYRRIDGKRYSHLIDPRTGTPVAGTHSVTVIAADCTTADAWATALSVLGPAGLARVEALDGMEAMMIVGDPGAHEVRMTGGFGSYVQGAVDLGEP